MVMKNFLLNVVKCGLRKISLFSNSCCLVSLYSAIALIYMEYKNPNLSVKTAIELKFFKRENYREPNNRYDVFQDIRNLEIYKNNDIDLCFFVLGTNHPHYFNAEQYSLDTSDFDFRQGSIYKKGTSLIYNTQKPYGAEIVLDSDYEFKWQEIGNFYFLKLEV